MLPALLTGEQPPLVAEGLPDPDCKNWDYNHCKLATRPRSVAPTCPLPCPIAPNCCTARTRMHSYVGLVVPLPNR